MQNWFDFSWDAVPSFFSNLDLPTVPPAAWLGLALLVAVWLGERLQRLGGSRTSGYWLCGAGIGLAVGAVQWHVAPAISAALGSMHNLPNTVATANASAATHWWAAGLGNETVAGMAVVAQALFNLALGWVLVELGQRMDWRWLLRNKALAATAVLEFALTWALAAIVLRSLDFDWLAAGAVATLVAHSSPVLLASLQQQWRAQGQVTERALHLGSINTVLTVMTLPLVLSWAGAYTQSAQVVASGAVLGGGQSSALPSLRSGLELAQPLWEVAASVLWGYALGWLLSHMAAQRSGASGSSGATRALSNPMVASFSNEWVYLAGAVCLAVGCAQWWGISALVACLALGLSLRTRALQVHAHDSHAMSALAQVLLFLVAGASLPWLAWAGYSVGTGSAQPSLTVGVLVLAALLLVLRLGAKALVCTLTAHWAGLRWAQGLALGLMLQPLSMTGLVLWGMAASVLTGPLAMLSMVYLLMLCVSDVLSPWAMQRVLRSMREVEPAPEPLVYSGLQTQSTVRAQHIDTESIPALSPALSSALSPALSPAREARHHAIRPQPQ